MGLHCDLGEIAAHSLTHSPTTVDSRDASASKNRIEAIFLVSSKRSQRRIVSVGGTNCLFHESPTRATWPLQLCMQQQSTATFALTLSPYADLPDMT